MKSIRVIPIVLSLILGMEALTGCVSKENLKGTLNASANPVEEVNQVKLENTTLTNTTLQGSMNVLPLMIELTQGLPYDVTAVGKEAAIEAVHSKTAQLAIYDGLINEAQGLTKIIAYSGVLLIVNPKSDLESVTSEEVRAFFTGEVGEIQGKTFTIVLPSQAVVSRKLFEELFPLKGEVNGMQKSLIPETAPSELTDEQVVQEVLNNPNAIGVILAGKINAQIKGLKLEGIEANETTIADGSYGAAKPIVLMADTSNEEIFNAFLEVIESEQGKEVIRKTGYSVKDIIEYKTK